MEDNKIVILVVLAVLAVLSFFILQPVLMSIIFGFVLVFICAPLYNLIHKKIKSKNLSASIITLLLLIVIVVPLIFLIPAVVNEVIKIYTFAENIDFVTPIEKLLPTMSQSGALSAEVDSILHSFITKLTTGMIDSVSNFLVDLPIILLQLTVVLFTFFFVMRDKEEIILYLKSILPFSKEVQEKLLKATGDVTVSVLYGQIVVGLITGAIAGVGFFLFGIPNALFFMILVIIAGVLPVIGAPIIWVPMVIYLLVTGNTVATLGVTIFGIASIIVENLLRPLLISKRLMINSLLALLGTIGGLLLFGVLGLLLGPLIIAYFAIFLEIYRNKKFSGLIVR
ncbi:MAG: AI-2E family transporter [Candidatus Nanoarchaeia archaeon]